MRTTGGHEPVSSTATERAGTPHRGGAPASSREASHALSALYDQVGNRRAIALLHAIQRRARDDSTPAVTSAVSRVLGEPGVPIADGPRADLEARFGAPFDSVRLHGGTPPAREAARDLGASAFTSAEHIVVGDTPPAQAPRDLLAHELAHVLQQRRGEGPPGGIDRGASDPCEQEADRIAADAIGGRGRDAATTATTATAATTATTATTATARTVQRQGEDAQTRIRRVLADADAAGVLALTREDMATTTPAQRAGLVRILLDQTWAGEREERRIVDLVLFEEQQDVVMRYLDALGDRQRLIDAVDDEELAMMLGTALGGAGSTGTGAVADALASGESAGVLALSTADLAGATDLERLGLLRILLDLSWSNEAEELRMVEILESSVGGRGTLVENLKALGLKQRLFDHIDSEAARLRLGAALGPIGDAEIDADLAVLQAGFFANLGAGLLGGLSIAWSELSPGAILMGILHPLIHPIDSIIALIDQLIALLQEPSVDRLITLARDVCGFIGAWLMALALLAWAVDAAAAAGVITLPASIPITVIAAGLTVWAEYFGIAYIVLAAVRLVWNAIEAGTATTARGLEHEQEELGEDISAVGIGLVFMGVARALKLTLQRLRDAAVDPDAATPENLDRIADQDTAARERHAARVRSAEEAAARETPEATETTPAVPEPLPEVPADLQALRETITDPAALAEFDRILADSARGADPYLRARRTFEGMGRGEGGLEAQLRRKAQLRTPGTPRGEVDAIREVDADARYLMDQIQANRSIAGTAQLIGRLRDAINGPIRAMMEGRVEATPERVAGERANIEAVWEEWRTAQEHGGVTGLGRKFPLRGEGADTHVDVDVVADEGRTWIEVKAIRPTGTHATDAAGRVTGEPHPTWADLRTQVGRLRTAAEQNPLPDGVVPRLVVRFPQGVSFSMLRALEAMDVRVEAPQVVDIGAQPPGHGAFPAPEHEEEGEEIPAR